MEKENKMTINKDLQDLSKELTKLVNQIEKLVTSLGKAEKPKAKPDNTKTKSKTKAKVVTKKAPAKAAKKTDTDKVLEIINRSKKGVDTATLMKKTGFDQKKVRNMLNRTYKQGKITRVAKGIYVGVK
jgi:predicted Rossmann fold nucleotide-binding protein DprA/Smf involved in DNA uptake